MVLADFPVDSTDHSYATEHVVSDTTPSDAERLENYEAGQRIRVMKQAA